MDKILKVINTVLFGEYIMYLYHDVYVWYCTTDYVRK